MIDTLEQHIRRSYEHCQNIMYIPDSLPYKIASSVLYQGIKCDQLARIIRKNLPAFLEACEKEISD